jgi:hypothetical protein
MTSQELSSATSALTEKQQFFKELRETVHQAIGVRKQTYTINDIKYLNAKSHNDYIVDLRNALKNLKSEDIIKFSNGLIISKEIETAWEDREFVWKYGIAPKYRRVLKIIFNGKEGRDIPFSKWIKKEIHVI